MKRALLPTLLLVIAATAPAGRAWVQLTTSGGDKEAWDLDARDLPNVKDGKITYYIDPAAPSSLTPGLSASDAVAAIRRGIAHWEEVAESRVAAEEDTSRPATGRKSGDHVNYVGWTDGELGPYTFGTTWPTWRNGRLEDADLLLNETWWDPRFDLPGYWGTRSPGSPDTADIESVVTHEWGHVLGLDHSGLPGATMYYSASPGAISFRSLHEDDRAAAATVYPGPTCAADLAVIRGVADVKGRGDDRGVHVIAVDAATGEVTASALSGPDGTYAIRGLPPGVYAVAACPYTVLGALNRYWSSASNSFLPAAYTTTGADPGPARLVRVTEGAEETGVDLDPGRKDDPLEPDDSRETATALAIGSIAAARIDVPGDRDHFLLRGDPGRLVSIRVHAAMIGSDLDPVLEVVQPDGRKLRSTDIRSPAFYANRAAGPDEDARIEDLLLADGDYEIVVYEQGGTFDSRAGRDAFYLLTVTDVSRAPSAKTSSFFAEPASIDAGGAAGSLLTAIPRNALGEPLGSGVTVSFLPGGGGSTGPVTDHGDGRYTALLTSGPTPGPDAVTVTLANDEGVTRVEDALTVRYLGDVSAETSAFSASPRRIRTGGTATATVTLLPRDALGQEFGPGRDDVIFLVRSGGGAVSSAHDSGDGSYTATYTAGVEPGAAALTATVNGKSLGLTTTVSLGFPLAEVMAEVREDVLALFDDPSTPEASRKKLGKAADALGTETTLEALVRAAKALEKAEKKSKGGLDLAPLTRELGEAARQAAREAIDAAAPGADAKAARKVEKAEAIFRKGEEKLAAGKHAKAASRYRKALRKVAGL